jgi:hypothetical protein
MVSKMEKDSWSGAPFDAEIIPVAGLQVKVVSCFKVLGYWSIRVLECWEKLTYEFQAE